eukprot:scaffold1026_cov409-Prasinococcus_capsulatus_cf.AAC.17
MCGGKISSASSIPFKSSPFTTRRPLTLHGRSMGDVTISALAPPLLTRTPTRPAVKCEWPNQMPLKSRHCTCQLRTPYCVKEWFMYGYSM